MAHDEGGNRDTTQATLVGHSRRDTGTWAGHGRGAGVARAEHWLGSSVHTARGTHSVSWLGLKQSKARKREGWARWAGKMEWVSA